MKRDPLFVNGPFRQSGKRPRPAGPAGGDRWRSRGSRAPLALALFVALVGGCTPLRSGDEDDGTGGPGGDGDPMTSVSENAAGCRGRACAADRPCRSGYRCVQEICFPDQGSCTDDNTCQSDTRCHLGACIPFDACKKLPAYDPNCKGQVFTPEEFKPPAVSCHLDGIQSLSIPVVADLDRDGRPEAITIAYPNSVVAMRTDTCTVLKSRLSAPLGA